MTVSLVLSERRDPNSVMLGVVDGREVESLYIMNRN